MQKWSCIGLRKLFPKFYSLFYFIPNGFTYYSQYDHLNTENTMYLRCLKSFCNIHIMTDFALGVPRLVNVLELNVNGGLQENFLSTSSTKQ